MIQELIICDGCGEPFFFPDLTHHWDVSLCGVCERDRQCTHNWEWQDSTEETMQCTHCQQIQR